jgi:outer membrane protein assembly factor BamB
MTFSTLALAVFVLPQSDWPQFRGPHGLSVADDSPIPTDFGPGQHVLWKATVPNGHSSPCVVGDRVFLTGAEAHTDVVLALDRRDGRILWSKRFEGEKLPSFAHPDATGALATVVSDGERLVAYFGNYGLVALDREGKLLWEKRLPQPRSGVFGVGTSPILFDGLLVLARDGAREASILVFDLSDGSELWRINRLGAGESHGTPFLWRNAEREELVVSGNGTLSSFDPGTGEALWSVGGLTSYPCTTPTADRDTLYFAAWSTPNATGRSYWEAAFDRSLELSDAEVADIGLFFKRLDKNDDGKVVPEEVPECRAKDAFGSIDADGNGSWERSEFVNPPSASAKGENLMVAVARGAAGDAGKEHVRWSWKRGLPYVSSPLCYRGRLWLFQSGGLVSVLDAKSGQALVDRERLSDRGEYYLSPVGAAGHVLAGSAEGTLYVFAAEGSELVIEHTVAFEEGLYATPAIQGGVVYLRTPTVQWAFGLPSSAGTPAKK